MASSLNASSDDTIATSSSGDVGGKLIITFRGLMGLTILAVNIIVIKCIKEWKKLNKTRKILLINISVADIILGLSFMLSFTFALLPIDKSKICHISSGTGVVSGLESISGITLLSIDLLISTQKLKKTNASQSNQVTKILVFALFAWWLISLGLAGWAVFANDKDYSKTVCTPTKVLLRSSRLLTVVCIGWALMITVVICNLASFYVARSCISEINENSDSLTPQQLSLRMQRVKFNMKISHLAMAVSLLFLVCWGPWFILAILFQFYPNIVTEDKVGLVGALSMLNSLGNIFIYKWRSTEFSAALTKLMCVCRPNAVLPEPSQEP